MPSRHSNKALAKLREAICHTPLPAEQILGLAAKIQQHFKWIHSPRPFQLQAIEAQLEGKDVIVHAGTGSGKTVIAAGAHTHPLMKGRVTMMVSPLIGLQEEQAETFRTKFNLTAIAINSSHGGLTEENMRSICQGSYQIVVMSPELLLSEIFINKVIRDPEFAIRVFAIVVDEAHVISHWGTNFRKKYGELGNLRALLPKGTPFVALSATMPPRIRRTVLDTLRFPREDVFVSINVGNDRHNVSLVCRAIEHPMNSYVDLDFVIPKSIQDRYGIPKTFIYVDNVSAGADVESYIEDLLPEFLRGIGLVRPYSAAFLQEYRTAAMDAFKAGHDVRVMICTDACGMGCNIPDIDVVVQWKLPGSISELIQRFGRAGRGTGTVGLAVLLAERSAYDLDLETAVVPGAKTLVGRRSGTAEYKKASTKEYAKAHGSQRGTHTGKHDAILVRTQPKLNPTAKDEGLLVFVQTGSCRREVCTEVFHNEPARPTVECCDNCCPELLDRTRPGKFVASRQVTVKQGVPCIAVKESAMEWHTSIYERDFQECVFGPSAILSDELINFLSSIGTISSETHLKQA